jgi:hypothetical protein
MTPGKKKKSQQTSKPSGKRQALRGVMLLLGITAVAVALIYISLEKSGQQRPAEEVETAGTWMEKAMDSTSQRGWVARAVAVSRKFHMVYTPCWEGAYGAMGDAFLFGAIHDSSLLRFHLVDHPLQQMCEGTWVDDRAWVCLAELMWWRLTGGTDMGLVMDAAKRYQEVRRQGRLSRPEGFWSWYNWPPGASVGEKVFTNSNMNQMVTVACRLYQATGNKRYLEDALLAWNGDEEHPGIEKTWYVGNGRWNGRPGHAAFGKELPWEGTGYCSVAAALYRVTGDRRYRDIAVQTAKRILDPSTGWVDPEDYYQLRMDGNGAFVNFLLDAHDIDPEALADVPGKIEKMLQHVWTNHHGASTVTLHRVQDHGIRNGWNPRGGEEGYGVGEIGTVHAQGEAARAFGAFVYFRFYFRPTSRQE